METMIRDIDVITMDEENPVLKGAFIGIDGGKIAYLGLEPPAESAEHYIEGAGKLAMPGLVNTHTHVSMSILRGYADDYALQDWLENHIWPAEGKMDARCIKAGALLGMAEMIAGGTISISDMYSKIPAVAEAAYEAGIYANISNGALCFDRANYDFATDSVTREMNIMLDTWHGEDDGRIRLDVAIHGEYTSFDRLWRANAAFARKHNLGMQVHLSETEAETRNCIKRYGRSPAYILAEAGVFDTPTIAAHCVYVDEQDMDILRAKGVTVAHNPVSNLKLASGVAPIGTMLTRGVNIALGTDGVASNNNHDMFEETKLAALLQKGVSLNPQAVPAWEALKMATVNGARGQGRADQIGCLREGMDASLILLNTRRPQLAPMHNPISSVVYAARGGDVAMTMVKGRVLYEDGRFTTLDMEHIYSELESYVMPRVFGA